MKANHHYSARSGTNHTTRQRRTTRSAAIYARQQVVQWSLIIGIWGLVAGTVVSLLSCGTSNTANTPTPGTTPASTGPFATRTLLANLNAPWEIVWGPDNFIWMTERNGRISRVDPKSGQQQTLLTVPDNYAQGESGLLGLALHPDFANQPFVYVVYTYQSGGIRERLVRYRYTGTTLDSRQVLLENIPANTFHDGSRLLITPDRHLLMTTGDAGNTALPQDPASLNGKILRFNLDGSVPTDNPFPGSYIWSLGHRNAQGLVVHPNGRLYASEHGPDSDDEINIITKGGNYGWPTVLGPINTTAEQTFAKQNNVTGSILDWSPTIAPSDLVYYTSAAIPQFQNKLLMTVLKNKVLLAVTLNADGTAVATQEKFFENQFGRLRDICVAPDGRVFLATNGDSYGSQSGHSLIEVKAGQ